MSAADSTPGRLAARSSSRSKNATRAGWLGYRVCGVITVPTSTPDGWKPRSAAWSRRKVRSSKPLPTSRISAIAISATTSARRTRWPSRPAVWRPLSLSTLPSGCREACSAGTSPKQMPVASVTSAANVSTWASMRTERSVTRSDGTTAVRALDAPQPDQHPKPAAERRQQQAFGEQLLHDPAAPRAEREPHRHLAAASGRPRQQQVRDVRAGDDQHEPDRGQEHEQRGAGCPRRPARAAAAARTTRRGCSPDTRPRGAPRWPWRSPGRVGRRAPARAGRRCAARRPPGRARHDSSGPDARSRRP